jgi:hypothetical protein
LPQGEKLPRVARRPHRASDYFRRNVSRADDIRVWERTDARRIFGAEVANRYAVIEVTVGDKSGGAARRSRRPQTFPALAPRPRGSRLKPSAPALLPLSSRRSSGTLNAERAATNDEARGLLNSSAFPRAGV